MSNAIETLKKYNTRFKSPRSASFHLGIDPCRYNNWLNGVSRIPLKDAIKMHYASGGELFIYDLFHDTQLLDDLKKYFEKNVDK